MDAADLGRNGVLVPRIVRELPQGCSVDGDLLCRAQSPGQIPGHLPHLCPSRGHLLMSLSLLEASKTALHPSEFQPPSFSAPAGGHSSALSTSKVPSYHGSQGDPPPTHTPILARGCL